MTVQPGYGGQRHRSSAAKPRLERARGYASARAVQSDVCLIVEGCYPFIRGGVSSWLDWLMRSQPHLSFSVIAIWPKAGNETSRYEFPANLVDLRVLYLNQPGGRKRFARFHRFDAEDLADALLDFVKGGGMAEFARVDRIVGGANQLGSLLNSRRAWHVVRIMYERSMPQASFLDYFWAWRSLFGGLFATLLFPLPQAKVYHTISTGYAGLVAARASVEMRRPALITEHGIYTNERRIEILMADWIADTVDKGLALHDTRFDLRDMWINAFEAYAKACYEATTEIITLYRDNQILQRSMGARADKLRVVANGLAWQRFADLPRAGDDATPTVALIGRVVPIKDVKTFISAVAILRREMPNVRAFVMGPVDEDPGYYGECKALAQQMGLDDCVVFTANVDITEWLPQIHVVLLTSLSEAQPLVLLEAGAAGIPCITTNVGSCAEILLGRDDEQPWLGEGGIITDVVAPAQIAAAALRLLRDHDARAKFGDALRKRVMAAYSNQQAVEAYGEIYRRHITASDRTAPSVTAVGKS